MTEPALTTLSVRGDARLVVAPDLATMYCGSSVYEPHKDDALRVAAAALDAVVGALSELGGVPLPPGAAPALGWTARSAGAHVERATRFSGRPAASGGGSSTPSLDPEPQELVAYIEARCSASVAPLPQS